MKRRNKKKEKGRRGNKNKRWEGRKRKSSMVVFEPIWWQVVLNRLVRLGRDYVYHLDWSSNQVGG